jgi:hypothetical protein
MKNKWMFLFSSLKIEVFYFKEKIMKKISKIQKKESSIKLSMKNLKNKKQKY